MVTKMERLFIRFTIADEWSSPMTDENSNVYIEVEWPFIPRKGEVIHLSDDERKTLSSLILKYIPLDRRFEDDNYDPEELECYCNITFNNLYDYDEIEKKRYVLIVLTQESD